MSGCRPAWQSSQTAAAQSAPIVAIQRWKYPCQPQRRQSSVIRSRSQCRCSGLGVHDQAREFVAAAFVVGGLVAGEPVEARRVAQFGVHGPPAAARSLTCWPQPGQDQVSGG